MREYELARQQGALTAVQLGFVAKSQGKKIAYMQFIDTDHLLDGALVNI